VEWAEASRANPERAAIFNQISRLSLIYLKSQDHQGKNGQKAKAGRIGKG
jgi:hypothetical protein